MAHNNLHLDQNPGEQKISAPEQKISAPEQKDYKLKASLDYLETKERERRERRTSWGVGRRGEVEG